MGMLAPPPRRPFCWRIFNRGATESRMAVRYATGFKGSDWTGRSLRRFTFEGGAGDVRSVSRMSSMFCCCD